MISVLSIDFSTIDIKPSDTAIEEKIEWLRDELHKCDLVNWADEYFAEACDGTHWSVRIEYENYCEIKNGSNHFPPKWGKFCRVISKVSDGEFLFRFLLYVAGFDWYSSECHFFVCARQGNYLGGESPLLGYTSTNH